MLVMGTLYFTATAQCGKHLVLKSSKTERLDKDGNVVDSRSEDVTVDITATSITIVPGDDHTMEGEIKSNTCDWKVPFKEGKSEIKALINDRGEMMNMTIIIEGKEGKLSMLAIFDKDGERRIRIWLDSFEEKK